MSVEVHVGTRGSLLPDPEHDAVLFVCYHIHNDWPHPLTGEEEERTGVLAVDISKPGWMGKSPLKTSPVKGKSPQNSPAKGKSPAKGNSPLKGKSPLKAQPPPSPPAFQQPVVGDHASSTLPDDNLPCLEHCGLAEGLEVTYTDSEQNLFDKLVHLVREVDPDILVGYEIQMSSWGYLNERAAHLGFNLIGHISRVPCEITMSVF